MEAGAAPVLVVPFGRAPDWPEAVRLLRGPFPFELMCPTPRPAKTRGEARLFRELVASHGWTRVVLVTSTYHARRARLLVGRCLPAGVAMTVVTARPRIGPLRWARVLVHEAGGLLWATLVRRGC
jgi:uncharacterized SAM-binding protein YcdF (DUF218 family)